MPSHRCAGCCGNGRVGVGVLHLGMVWRTVNGERAKKSKSRRCGRRLQLTLANERLDTIKQAQIGSECRFGDQSRSWRTRLGISK